MNTHGRYSRAAVHAAVWVPSEGPCPPAGCPVVMQRSAVVARPGIKWEILRIEGYSYCARVAAYGAGGRQAHRTVVHTSLDKLGQAAQSSPPSEQGAADIHIERVPNNYT